MTNVFVEKPRLHQSVKKKMHPWRVSCEHHTMTALPLTYPILSVLVIIKRLFLPPPHQSAERWWWEGLLSYYSGLKPVIAALLHCSSTSLHCSAWREPVVVSLEWWCGMAMSYIQHRPGQGLTVGFVLHRTKWGLYIGYVFKYRSYVLNKSVLVNGHLSCVKESAQSWTYARVCQL